MTMFFMDIAITMGHVMSRKNKSRPDVCAAFHKNDVERLFDFTLFIFDMLAHNRIILPDHHFFGHGARVFLGHVKVASVRGRVQADFNCGRLRHFSSPASAKGQAGEMLS